jgi:uncharacterized protein YndB with AHSA1/START domain
VTDYIAQARIEIDAAPERVWAALTDPAEVSQYFFGTELVTDWQVGHPVRWRGEWQGKPYEDKGEVLTVEPPRRLRLTHFSPMTGQADVPENYHTISYELTPAGPATVLRLRQDNNADQAEADRSTETWQSVLAGLKQHIEGSSG